MKILGSDETIWTGGFSPGLKRRKDGGTQNLPPVLVDGFATAVTGESVTISVFDDAYDPEGQSMTVVAAMAINGSVVIELDGQLTYTSEPDFIGTDTIAYTVEDAQGASSQGIVTVTVMAAELGNQPPVAGPDTATVLSGGNVSIPVLLNDSDPEGGALSVTDATATAGNVTIEPDGTLSYTAPADFGVLLDQRVTEAEAVYVGTGTFASSGELYTLIQLPYTVPDGQSVGVVVRTDGTVPAGTVYTVKGDGTDAIRVARVDLTSDEFFVGLPGPATITYTIADPQGATAQSTVTVTITAANQPPVAMPDTATVLAGGSVSIPVLANDTDPEGGALKVTAATAEKGSVQVEADNRLTYTAAAGSSGTDTITYSIADPQGATAQSTVTVTITAANQPPVAGPDTTTVLSGGTDSITVLANDTDPEGQPLSITQASAQTGSVTVEADNTLTYTAPADFSGADTVTYTITDAAGQTAQGQVAVTVVKLTISESGTPGEFVITAAPGQLTITVVEPVEYAGSYPLQTADLAAGPVNLVAPKVSGNTGDKDSLTATPGLWICDDAHVPFSVSGQWLRDGTPIQGQTGSAYTVDVGLDGGKSLQHVETGTDSAGNRSASSGSITVPAAPTVPPATWTPSDLADVTLRLWLDAADSTKRQVNSAGLLTRLDDKSSFGAHATPTGAAIPLTTWSGSTALDVATGNALRFPHPSVGGGTTRGFLGAFGPAPGTAQIRGLFQIGTETASENRMWGLYIYNGEPDRIAFTAGNGAWVAPYPGVTDLHTASGLFGLKTTNGNYSSAIAFRNGTQQTMTADWGTTFSTAVATYGYVGRTQTVWAPSQTKGLGVFGEVIFWTGDLADTEIRKLEGYLAHKWGLTANLPADHPYKSAPPNS